MLKIIVTRGIPASGKSTWSVAEISKDPDNWLRINNDSIRNMTNSGVWSPDYEKIIAATRQFMIREGLKRNKNIIVDNVNASSDNWKEILTICAKANKDITVTEKHFYISLEDAVARDAARTGTAKVGAEIIMKFWKKLGGKQFEYASPKIEQFFKRTSVAEAAWIEMVQDESLDPALIVDMDGTYAKIGDRSPYDASMCDVVDRPIFSTVETVRLFHKEGYKIIFCSGRMEKDRAPTERFIQANSPNMPFQLFMRTTDDQRPDVTIKKELFERFIKNKYWIRLVLDDRKSVAQQWHDMGLNLFRVGDPSANF